ncbi:MAG: TolC family protein [Blastocatellia bacterium]|nr:TolC family protein [Blastocatellia bacterium]
MWNYHQKAIFIIVALLGIGFLPANSMWAQSQPAAQSLTLKEAVDLALRQNPGVQAVNTNRKLARLGTEEAKSGRLPTVQASEVLTNGNNPVYVFGSLLEQSRFTEKNFGLDSLNNPTPLTNFRSSVQMRLPLFDQRMTQTRIAKAQNHEQEAALQAELAEQQARLEVIRAYYGVLVAEAHKNVTAAAVQSVSAEAKRVNDLYETGVVTAADRLALATQLAEYQQQDIEAAGTLRTAHAALNLVVGLPLETVVTLNGKLTNPQFTIPAEAALLEAATTRHPELQLAELAIAQRKQEQTGARGQYLPRADLFANVGASAEKLVNGSSDYAVGVSLTWNLFDPGRRARVGQADTAREIAELQQKQTADQLRLQVIRARERYQSARERLPVAANAVTQAAETLRIVRDRYGVGLTTITEVLRAQTALVQAESNEVFVRYECTVRFGELQLAAGQLTEVTVFDR